MDYKKMYYSLFNSITTAVEELNKDGLQNQFAVKKLEDLQIKAEELYLDLSENTGKTVDIKKVKKTLSGKVG